MKILLIRLSAVGDVVRTLPALTSLRCRFPSAQIDWAVEESSQEILRDQPDLDSVLVFPRRKLSRILLHPDEIGDARRALSAFLEDLKQPGYDLVVDFQGTLKTALMARLTGAPRIVGLGRGHSRELSHLLYTEPVALPRGPMSRVDRALALAGHLGGETRDVGSHIPERAEDAAYVDLFLSSLPPGGNGKRPMPPAVVFPGTSRTQAYKRYPPARFAEAADLIAERAGFPIVVAWGPGEQGIAGEVISAMRAPATLAPALTLGQLTSLIRRSSVFLAGDTGPMHIAWTVGAPVVAVYGPTDPKVNRPGGPFSEVAYRKVFCSPCRNRGCIARTCLEHLPAETVADAALSVVARAELAGYFSRPASPAFDDQLAGEDPAPEARPRFETMGPGSRPHGGE